MSENNKQTTNNTLSEKGIFDFYLFFSKIEFENKLIKVFCVLKQIKKKQHTVKCLTLMFRC